MYVLPSLLFFFNDTATTEIYTLSLHDALPICLCCHQSSGPLLARLQRCIRLPREKLLRDRKSTRLTPVTVKSRMPSSACKRKMPVDEFLLLTFSGPISCHALASSAPHRLAVAL